VRKVFMDDQKQQEVMFKLSIFEQQIRQLQEQHQAVEQAIAETNSLTHSLEDLKDSKGKEIFASIGKGIFVRGEVKSEDLIVDVGGKRFVNKSIPETQELIKKQVKKLDEIKIEIEENLEKINEELTKVFEEAQK